MRLYTTYILLFLLVGSPIVAQNQELLLEEVPEDYQLYPRDLQDSAMVFIKGKLAKESAIKNLILKVFKDDGVYDIQQVSLENKAFSLATKIDAGLHQFRFELYLKNKKKDILYLVADSVVCGDAYIITGQSNSHASSTRSNYSSPFCRSFGVKTGYESYSEKDKQVRWGKASGNCPGLENEVGGWFTKNPFGIGVWGMELARQIVEKHKVPVCIINGGSGSSSIEQNMLYPEEPSLETSFGRLVYRVNQAGLKDDIKAIFWHQGESNTNTIDGYQNYLENFNALQTDWRRVYTGLQKIYLFQLHPGCGRKREGYYNELMEIQNQIAEKYGMVEIMSTTGVTGHDGCHFSYEGYLEFARRIFPLVSRDFYGEKTQKTITPPKLLRAEYTSTNKVTLIFDQPISVEEKREIKGQTYFLKDQFFFKDALEETIRPTKIKGLEVHENQLHIIFEKAGLFKYITYLPGKFYFGTKEIYNGPWLSGSENGLGALGFHQRPISQWPASATKDPFSKAGYQMLDSTLNGVKFKLVFPKKNDSEKPWIWRARFWGHEPQTDLALLEKGFHVAYIDVAGLFGNEQAIRIWDDFYEFMVTKFKLNPKVVLEGMSRGGLIVFNWANRNAEKVAAIYVDAPVCDFKSWPAGKGVGTGSVKAWGHCLEQYGFSEEIALQYSANPIDHMEHLASQKIPILSVVGDADKVVPVSENTTLIEQRLLSLGWKMTIIHKPNIGHHPHSLEDPKPIVNFVLKHTRNL
ncbi:MAG: sialate O-acetylesterase [Flavobacteriaceae bacterium]